MNSDRYDKSYIVKETKEKRRIFLINKYESRFKKKKKILCRKDCYVFAQQAIECQVYSHKEIGLELLVHS